MSTINNFFVTYAKYNGSANEAVFSILDKLSNEEREQDRGSYYKSLSGLVRHVLGGTKYFLATCGTSVPNNDAAQKALAPLAGVSIPEGELTADAWKSLGPAFKIADAAYTAFVSALGEKDLDAPVKIEWYGGNPASVPLFFMLQQITAHNTHHRGQISQILDSLKIDNDYSGIEVALLPK
jgi:uncharacterized damage-inducible protein DinB